MDSVYNCMESIMVDARRWRCRQETYEEAVEMVEVRL